MIRKKENWKESQRKKASKPVYLIIYSNVYVCVFTCEPIHSTSVNGTRDFSNAACSVHSFYVALPEVTVCDVCVKQNKRVNIILCTVTALCVCCCRGTKDMVYGDERKSVMVFFYK